MTSPAVVFTAAGQVAFQPVEVPPPNPDEVVVQTDWSWISNGTEGSFLRGERADGETPATAERPAPYPICPGYQRVGTVVDAGAESGYQPGERVFVTVSRMLGLATSHGGHIHRAPAHRDQLRRLPPGLPPEAYAGLVLTQVGYNCGLRPALAGGEAAVVIGDGLVGHWAAQTLQHRGARVLLVGRHPDRLGRLVLREGDAVTTERDDALVATVRDWAGGGVRAIIDTVGTVATLNLLFWTLAHNGHLVSAGYCGPRGEIDIQMLRKREATLHNPSGWTGPRLDATLAGVRDGWLTTLPLVTDRLPAGEAAEAWRRIQTDRDRTLGVLLDWREIEG